jgi:fatty acid CoA ligase FadD9
MTRAESLIKQNPDLGLTRPDASILHELSTSRSCLDFLDRACQRYRHRPALGARPWKTLAEFQTLTYGELWDRVNALAAGWHHENLVSAKEGVGILGFASPDFVVVEWACLVTGAMSAPLQAHMPAADLIHCINEAELTCLACSVDILENMSGVLTACPRVTCIIIMDLQDAEVEHNRLVRTQGRLSQLRPQLRILTLTQLESLGLNQGPAPLSRRRPDADPIRKVLYTSGSTGSPKGALIPESLLLAKWRKYTQPPHQSETPAVGFNFAPLNHLAGSNVLMRSVARGSLLYFTLKSDMSTLFEDIRLARPTEMFIIPRISNMIYQHFQMEVLRLASRHPNQSLETHENQVIREMRHSFLGDRLLELRTGSAPTAPEVLDFLRRCFDVPVHNVYGSTEADVIAINDRVARPHVIDYKLIDVPELSYSQADQPYPRGELRVRLQHAVPGYLHRPQSTSHIFDEEGYLITGDIFEERAPDHIVWVDRKKNVVKLSQGEFVSVWRLESLYMGGNGRIDQIYLYASSLRSYILAVLVPNPSAQAAYPSPSQLKEALREELQSIAAKAGLHAYEIPRDFIVEQERFSKENGLLTESGKQNPGRLKQKYQQRLEELYQDLERRQLQTAMEVPEAWSDLPMASRIHKALTAILGVEGPFQRSFRDFGGDSLSAVRLSVMLENMTGVSVPVSHILNPNSSLETLVTYVEQIQSGQGDKRRHLFTSIHGQKPQSLRAEDLKLDQFLSPGELSAARRLPGFDESAPITCVLLTGANGFLGRFLMLELANQLPADGIVICLVRAADDDAAAKRLLSAFDIRDTSLEQEFSQLIAQGRIVPVAGDLTEAKFGLSDKGWHDLSQKVDAIVHNGALVNHAFSYEQLFEPNVLGTVETIRFALQGRRKAFTFISSVAVAGFTPRAEPVREHIKAQALWSEWPIRPHYAAGYAATKWAGEILLDEMQERFSIPVTVIRCGMILAHTQWLGHMNVSDYFSRLLCGLVLTGVAPQSFYADPQRSQPFDGIPVDFVARSLAALASHPQPGYSIYHMVNDQTNEDASLDAIAQWIRTAHYHVDSIPDYETWYQSFGARLQALDEKARHATPLPILYQWEHPMTEERHLRLDASRLHQRLRELDLPPDAPRLGESYIHHCLASLRKLGVITAP